MVVSVSPRHMGLFERRVSTFICRHRPDAPSSERLVDSKDPESRFTQAIPIAGRSAIGAPHATSPHLEIDVYHSTHNGRFRR